MAGQNQMPNMDQFEAYFRRADLDQDGRISGAEAVGFFQGSNLPKQVLAQIWTYADQNRTGFLGRAEFYNALKLVTVAQRKRELTPDIVKAALYSPASAQIPPPQINLAMIPPPQSNFRPGAPTPQFSGTGPTSQGTTGFRGPQDFTPQPNQFMRPPRPLPPTPAFNSQPGFGSQQPGFGSQGMSGGGTMVASRPPSRSISTDWQGVGTGAPQSGITSQIPTRGISPSTALDGFGFTSPGSTQLAQPRPQATVGLTQPAAPKPNEATPPVSGNGFASDSMFGDVFSATPSQAKQDSLAPTSSSGGLPATSAIVPASAGPQNAVMSSGLPVSSATAPVSGGPQQTVTSSPQVSLQSTFTRQPTVNQHQQIQPTANQNQNQVSARNLTGYPSGPGNSAPGQSQQPWPRMTPASVQKYSKVFVEVDTDRDGKITGEQARNLFLSWRLPREILKQVWDLSDQDNDSMLSLTEFCVALYLMERYREGRPLPSVLPSGIMLDKTQLPPSAQLAAPHGNTAWAPSPGLQQSQGMPGARPVPQASSARPPRPGPVPIPQEEEAMPPRQQKPRVPVLEKHLVDQLSTEEQNSLNSKFQEATEADKKVDELEKEIMDSREKIEFYRTKMQELILYKSRCDNRLNEIIERVSADKREVEALAKKYEEKYKQSGDVASKLTIEEATFRDIQEKKMELYRAIVKLEEDGGDPEAIQGRADRVQLDLEEQVKALNERCKVYGLRGKPTTLVELPFGWQPGIQEGAADLDEDWDKFEDEGFSFVKEFTLDVQNVIAPPKTKSSLIQDKASSQAEDSTAVSSNNLSGAGEKNHRDESANSPSKDAVSRTPPESPSRRNAMDSPINSPARKYSIDSLFDSPSRKSAIESPSNSPTIRNSMESPTKKFDVSPSRKNNGDHSPHFDSQSEHGGAEYKGFDEAGWGTFDSHYDTDAGWDFNPKETNREVHNESSFFGADDWGLNPIKTGPTYTDNANQKKSSFPFADSVPSTPAYSSVGSPQANNLFQKKAPFGFADSVPSTPMYNTAASPFANNLFQNKSSFGFADSVPSTPMYNDVDTNSFDTFSRFDSFSLNDGGTDGGSLFPTRDSSLSRFDSMRSTRDSEYDHGFYPPSDLSSSFARFDSMRSTQDSDFGPGLTRFDSMRSTSDFGHGFPSFDDSDPFGSSDPFKTSSSTIESQTPRRDSDSWRAF